MTAQTPASKTRTTVPLDAKSGRHQSNRPSSEHTAASIASLSVCSRQAQTRTLHRRQDLCASAAKLKSQNRAVAPPSRLVEHSESRAVLIVTAIRWLHGEDSIDRIVRTWARIDAVRVALLFPSSPLRSIRLAQGTVCIHRSLGIVSTYVGCR